MNFYVCNNSSTITTDIGAESYKKVSTHSEIRYKSSTINFTYDVFSAIRYYIMSLTHTDNNSSHTFLVNYAEASEYQSLSP